MNRWPSRRDLLHCDIESLTVAIEVTRRRHMTDLEARALVSEAEKLLRKASDITHKRIEECKGILSITENERELCVVLRRLAVEEITRRPKERVACRLGLMPGGVDALLWKSEWSLETAFRVADCLGLPVIDHIVIICSKWCQHEAD